jgi:hypothetical protein
MPGKIQIKYDLAIKDYKYAEEQRRFFKKRVESQKDSVQDVEAKLVKMEKDLLAANKVYVSTAKAWTNDPTNTAKRGAYKNAQLKVQDIEKQKAALNIRLNAAKSALSSYSSVLTKLTDITNKTSQGLLTTDNPGNSNGENAIGSPTIIERYYYNAPAMNSVYFTNNSLQTNLTSSQKAVPSTMLNALTDAFKTPNGNRGVIQTYSLTAKQLQKQLSDKQKKSGYDTKPYGFRFHYNPTSISMTYGSMDKLAPELMRDEMQNFNAVTPINVGGISFEIYLNRIDDLSFIKSNGTLSLGNQTFESAILYPETVDPSELKQIYRKGTMYDLEYLFRAIHGGGNDYTSILRGKTSDLGWISRAAVEVHLGDGLRFLVSLNNIGVNHVLFNDRMVPMLTVITIQGSRFMDSPMDNKKKK